MRYRHIDLPLSKLQFLASQSGRPAGENMVEWWLDTHAPGRLIGVTSFLQPKPGTQLTPQGPQIEPCFHFFFEVAQVIQ